MDLIAQGRITKNLIEPPYELVDTFNTYWASMMPPGSTDQYGLSLPPSEVFPNRAIGDVTAASNSLVGSFLRGALGG
jgi:hypothetical protein